MFSAKQSRAQTEKLVESGAANKYLPGTATETGFTASSGNTANPWPSSCVTINEMNNNEKKKKVLERTVKTPAARRGTRRCEKWKICPAIKNFCPEQ